MSFGMFGARTDDLRELSGHFGNAADRTSDSFQVVLTVANDLEWEGKDADEWRERVSSRLRRLCASLEMTLTDTNRDLVRQADDQDATSSASKWTAFAMTAGGAGAAAMGTLRGTAQWGTAMGSRAAAGRFSRAGERTGEFFMQAGGSASGGQQAQFDSLSKDAAQWRTGPGSSAMGGRSAGGGSGAGQYSSPTAGGAWGSMPGAAASVGRTSFQNAIGEFLKEFGPLGATALSLVALGAVLGSMSTDPQTAPYRVRPETPMHRTSFGDLRGTYTMPSSTSSYTPSSSYTLGSTDAFSRSTQSTRMPGWESHQPTIDGRTSSASSSGGSTGGGSASFSGGSPAPASGLGAGVGSVPNSWVEPQAAGMTAGKAGVALPSGGYGTSGVAGATGYSASMGASFAGVGGGSAANPMSMSNAPIMPMIGAGAAATAGVGVLAGAGMAAAKALRPKK